MPDRFSHYLPLSLELNEEIWNDAAIVLDTNVFLHIYRTPEDVRSSFLKIIQNKVILDRLWIPYQVAEEFYRNRIGVIRDQEVIIREALDAVRKNIKELGSELDKKVPKRHPLIDREAWKNAFEEQFKKLIEHLDGSRENYPFAIDKDPHLDQIKKLMLSRVGDPLQDSELDTIKNEADINYKKGTPPGFQDEKKKGPDQGYGDFFIWKQILKEMSGNKRHTIFVTDDAKDDWWLKELGKKIGARPELRKEYLSLTGKQFVLCSTQHFIEWANEHIEKILLQEELSEMIDYLQVGATKNKGNKQVLDWIERELEVEKHASKPEVSNVSDLVEWFLTFYEDPANGVPYEGREGGYQYYAGGPYDAREVLEEYFPEVPEGMKDRATDQIEDLGIEWVRKGQY